MRPSRPRGLALVALLALLAGSGSPAAAQAEDDDWGSGWLFPHAAVPISTPRSAVFADMNGDGIDDLVVGMGMHVGDAGDMGVEVLLGHPTGGFEPPVYTHVRNNPRFVQVADVDDDGLPDVLVGQNVPNQSGRMRIAVLRGTGGAALQPAVEPGLPLARALTAGRFLPDQQALLALATDEDVQVLRAESDLQFTPVATLEAPDVRLLETADLDADGTDEMVTWSSAGATLTVYRGLEPVAERSVPGVTALRAADATGDGRPEILVGDDQGVTTVYRADLTPLRSVDAGHLTIAADAVDLDGDGLPDLVTANAGAGVSVFFGDGREETTTLHEEPLDVFVGDATGDGVPNLLFPLWRSSALAILANDGTGALPPLPHLVETADYSWFIEVADFDGDGNPDLLASEWDPFLFSYETPNAARVLLGDGEGGFELSAEVDTSGGPQAAAAGDFNGNGALDLVVTDAFGHLSQYFGAGDGTFGPRVPGPGCTVPLGLVVADLDGDGYDDAVAVCRALFGFGPDQVMVLFGSPAGLVRGQQLQLVGSWSGVSVRVGDLNGDGLPDIVVGSHLYVPHDPACPTCSFVFDQGVIAYFLGVAPRVWDLVPREVVPGSPSGDLAVVDLDGDGYDDIVAPLFLNDEVRVYPGRADGELGDPYAIPTLPDPAGINVVDLTSDGHLDLVVPHDHRNVVSVTRGGPDGFGEPVGYLTHDWTWRVPAADVNGDGRLELLAGQFHAVEVLVQR